ncbi:MAG: (2E,6E)-farnesyl diphosphate synthase [Thiohalomonadaceae bacterium]
MDLQQLLRAHAARAEAALQQRLPPADELPARLHAAMRYAALDGGKRVRPVLVYTTGEVLGVPLEQLDGPACAVELIHAYSLVHDDLPAMDNDDLRRGKPTCHKAFDEASAILAGDALQTLAFQVLAEDPAMAAAPAQRLAMVRELAVASGSRGMAGGQAIDMAATGKGLSLPELQQMHSLKTGALIRAAVRLGALSRPGLAPALFQALDDYAAAIGLAFQIRDDILDVESSTEQLGKRQGADQALAKSTYVALLGLDGAKAKAREVHAVARTALTPLGEAAAPLAALADFIVERVS